MHLVLSSIEDEDCLPAVRPSGMYRCGQLHFERQTESNVQVGDVSNNLNRADAVLSRANPKDLDLLVLPELAFSG
jgi:hypothetical protein